ncbi:MAG: FAD-dependent oxidoreductase [Pseudomonadota bacterium]
MADDIRADVPPEVNRRFTPEEIERMTAYGDVLDRKAGDMLFREGDKQIGCYILMSGQLDIEFFENGEKTRIGWLEPGQFTGDVSIIAGQASSVFAQMKKDGQVLHLPHDKLQRLLVEDSRLSDAFVSSFMARRAWQRASGRSSVTVIGAPYNRETFAIRDLLTKHDLTFHFLDPDTHPLAAKALEAVDLTVEDTPVVLRGKSLRLVQPSLEDISKAFGLDLLPDGACADVLVIGAGPGGLAASVYAASEGLSVLTLDMAAPGGQAATSSKIENYLGFPTGISGRELADRAAVQAQKFGARIAGPVTAEALERVEDDYRLTLKDGRSFGARAVVLAMGAQYRKLPIENLEFFEGRGVYYGATPMEAQLCGDATVAVVGAGNSAGQGAVFLSQTAAEVHVAYRRANIRDTMSEYLVRRLEETPNIHLHPNTEVTRLEGCDERLRKAELVDNAQNKRFTVDLPFLFMFIGAQPCTEWLPDSVACDGKGFLKTGSDVTNLELVRAGWTLDRMPTRYETAWPGVYAVGDVRSGSVKRVASAVGEGSVVISDVHAAISEKSPGEPA